MMQEYVICEKEDLVAMADAVREATGDVETYSVPELRDALINSYKNLSGGSMSEAQIIEIIEKYLNDNPINPDSISTALSQAFNEQDVLDITMELGFIDPVVAYDGSFYINENGSIYSM